VITFKSTEDLAKLKSEDPAFTTVRELVNRLITAYTTSGQPYNWQDYGYVILVQEDDVNRTLDEIWDGLAEAGFRSHPCGKLKNWNPENLTCRQKSGNRDRQNFRFSPDTTPQISFAGVDIE
jgi:hypothetical protein